MTGAVNHYHSVPLWSDWRRDPPLLTVSLQVPPPSGRAKGGHARAAKLSPERRKEIAKLAAQTRWGKWHADHVADAGKMIERDWLFVASKGRMGRRRKR